MFTKFLDISVYYDVFIVWIVSFDIPTATKVRTVSFYCVLVLFIFLSTILKSIFAVFFFLGIY